MSLDALNWAFRLELRPASVKFVLVGLANRANDESNLEVYCSVSKICSDTCLDRKTVIAALNRLRELGLIIDTGKRKGNTKQIVVYQVAANKEQSEASQNRNSTENGTVPLFPSKSTVFPIKGSQKRDTEPKGTTREHKNISASKYTPDFETAWSDYPKREGGNPKRKAFQAWTARIKSGADPQEMRQGVQRYARFIRAKGLENTAYVKQAATFLGPDEAYLEEWEVKQEHKTKQTDQYPTRKKEDLSKYIQQPKRGSGR